MLISPLRRCLYSLTILAIVVGLLPQYSPAVQAETPDELPSLPVFRSFTGEDPAAFVSLAVGQRQVQVPLSPGARNGLLAAQRTGQEGLSGSDPLAGLDPLLEIPIPATTGTTGHDGVGRSLRQIAVMSDLSSRFTVPKAQHQTGSQPPAGVPDAPPEPPASPRRVFLPLLSKSEQPADWTIITPAGGSLTSPDGQQAITFTPDGLPESLRIAFFNSGINRRDLPLNLYPLGIPFTIKAYWLSDSTGVDALDREAQPWRNPGEAKPQPPQYRYRATVSVQLSAEDLRVVDDQWLTIARLDSSSGKWTLLPTQLNRQTGIATAVTERLGTFVLVQNMPNTPAITPSDVVALPRVAADPAEVVVDDLDPEFNRYQDPRVPGWFWWEGSCGGGGCYAGHSFWTWNRSAYENPWLPPGEPCNWATWTPALPQPGYYLVSVFIPGTDANTRGADYEIHHSGGVDTVTVDQAASSGTFVNLNAFNFDAGGSEYLYLDDVVPETNELGSRVGFDAAIFTFGGEAPPSPEEIARLFTLGVRRWQKYVGDPVSSSTGNHVQQIEVVRIPGRDGSEMALVLTYNAHSNEEGVFGAGWSSLLDMHLKQYFGGSVMVWMPDGQGQYWESDGEGYIGWDGVQSDLAKIDGGWRLTTPDQTTYIFQEVGWEGRLVRVEDRHGNGIHLLWNGEGKVTGISDDSGRWLTFSYDGDRISQVQDPLSRTWGFGYDAGRLVQFRNANGGTTRYTYTGDGYLETLTDPQGIVYLHNIYDGQGRVTEQGDADGSHSYWTYDDGNRTVVFTDNLGRQTTYRYDEQFRLVEEKDPLGQTISYEYDDDYNLTARVDKMGRRWEYTYDDRGNLLTESGPLGWHLTYTYNDTNDRTSMTDALNRRTDYIWENGNLVRVERPDGTTFVYTYDGHGQRLTATDPDGHTTYFTYDEHGNLAEVRSPMGYITRYEYDIAGRMTSMTDGNGHTARFEYDGNDNLTRILDPRQHETRFEYDGNDCLVKMTDRRGGVWTYEYDRNLKLTAETDPEGHRTTHAYDKMYNRISTTDPRGHTTTFDYDDLYRLVRVKDALDGVTRYEYDPNDNLVRVIDALEQTTRLEYDELNRLVKVTDALNGETKYYYDEVSRLVRLVNPRDAETRYTYDDVDRLIRVTDALGGETDYSYDDAGNLVAVTDANDHTTYFRYDADDRLRERQDPAGHVTVYQRDGVGNLIRLVDARNNPTTFGYDENDNLILITDALGGQTRFTYDEEDARTSVTDPNNHTTRFAYNRDGLLVQLTEAGGQVSRFEYDEAHNLVRLINAKGNATTFEYDKLNRLIVGTDPLGHSTAYEYDKLSRLVALTDANRIVTRYEYDPLDRLTAVVQNYRPDQPADHQTNVRTAYTYDPVGNLLTITDANGHVTHFAYDLLDRLTREVNPIESTWRYEYDPVGNLKRRIDANGAITDYTYEADDLLVGIHYPDGSQVTFAYDETHNQVTMTDGLGVTHNTYDPLNRLTSSTNHLGQRVGYAYDPASNRVAVTYPDGRVVRTEYDPTNYPNRVIDPDGNAFAADYDPTHNVTRILYPNQMQALMTYDAADRLVSVLNEQLDGDDISTFAYTLDPVGNRIHSDEYYRWRQPRDLSHDYAYDPLYRLVGSQDSEGRFTDYAYDAVGNRLQMRSNYDPLRTPTDVDPYTVDYTYNAANQLLTTDHSLFGVTSYTYDANGNRVRRQGPDVWIGNPHDQLRTDYTYDYENRLTWVGNFFDPGNGQWQVRDETAMLYDGYGRLFRRTHDQHQGGGGQKWTEFVYDGLDPIAEYVDPSPQYTNYYRGLGRILSLHDFKSQQSPPGTAYYFHYDGLGSVSAITKHQGQSAHTYRYWDYGMVLDKNDRAADSSNFTDPHNHYTFTGQEWEEYTWLYHFYAREYDPVVGVWLQQDPYRGQLGEPVTLHRYGYVGADPTSYIDSYGYGWGEALIGAIGGAALGAVTMVAVTKNPWAAAAGAVFGAIGGGIWGYSQNWFSKQPITTNQYSDKIVEGAKEEMDLNRKLKNKVQYINVFDCNSPGETVCADLVTDAWENAGIKGADGASSIKDAIIDYATKQGYSNPRCGPADVGAVRNYVKTYGTWSTKMNDFQRGDMAVFSKDGEPYHSVIITETNKDGTPKTVIQTSYGSERGFFDRLYTDFYQSTMSREEFDKYFEAGVVREEPWNDFYARANQQGMVFEGHGRPFK